MEIQGTLPKKKKTGTLPDIKRVHDFLSLVLNLNTFVVFASLNDKKQMKEL